MGVGIIFVITHFIVLCQSAASRLGGVAGTFASGETGFGMAWISTGAAAGVAPRCFFSSKRAAGSVSRVTDCLFHGAGSSALKRVTILSSSSAIAACHASNSGSLVLLQQYLQLLCVAFQPLQKFLF